MATLTRPPLYSPRIEVRWTPTFDPPNRLPLFANLPPGKQLLADPVPIRRLPDYGWIYAPVPSTIPLAQLPFNQFDWPVPKGAVWRAELLAWSNINPMPFTGGAMPPTPYDLSVPKGPQNPVANLTWLAPTNPAFFPAPPPPSTTVRSWRKGVSRNRIKS